jgi:hypothetical protein
MAEWIGLDPTSGPLERRNWRKLRLRPATLDGHVIGLVANGLGRGAEFFDALYEELAKSYKLAGAVRVLKPSVAVRIEPADWARLTSQATVAITGFGGCGSCSSRSLRDAIELEWVGIPSVGIMHESVRSAAEAMARLSGAPDYPFIVVEHPYEASADWSDAEIRSLAQALATKVRALLTRGA